MPSSSHVGPRLYTRLYKHALESIFAHLRLSDLAHVSATCRDWSVAVNSMRTIGATIKMKQPSDLHSMCTSRLMRHVVATHLTGISISVSDLSSLCDIIKQSQSLTTVNLGNTRIGVEGASAIAEAIKQSKSLTTVTLSSNDISDEGASAIAEAIKQSKSLATVNLRYNQIGDVGASALAEAIKQSQSIVGLW